MRSALLLLAVLAAPAQEFDSAAVRTVMVPMRDGVRLATDLYLPARGGRPTEGRFPVLLVRTPYDKTGGRGAGNFFARHGYVVAVQDVRGRFASEDDFYPFVNEGLDGYDAIEWAAAQPFSSGKVGTFGASYLAWDQYHAAMYRPPHLEAMFANVGGAVFYDEYAYPGGAPNLGWPLWILRSAQTSPQAARNPRGREKLEETWKNAPAWLALHPRERAAVFAEFPAHRRAYEDFYAHPSLDPYWKQRGFFTPAYWGEMKDVPTFFITGWYDYFAEGVLANFSNLSRMRKAPRKLWVGPWPHGIGAAACGDGSFGPAAAVDINALMLDWFDHWLKGKPLTRIGPEAVRIFRMGGGPGTRDDRGRREHGGEWLTARAWPLPEARAERYYLREPGALSAAPPASEAPSTFVFDPEHPVPTIGGRYGSGTFTPLCAQDQVCKPGVLGCSDARPLSERADVLSFSTAPLERAVAVAGKVQVRLWVSSDAPDTDFSAKLVDVYPDGYALILASGRLRASYREGFDRPRPLEPGKPYEITVDLGSTANRFAPGHRIRVDISSSSYPEFEPNPNTGEPAGSWTRRVKARNTVFHQAGRASYVELPVTP